MENAFQIKTIIIEDNLASQEFLENTIVKNYPSISIAGKAVSVKESIALIKEAQPELVFMDIELTDGLSFEIFEKITPNFEVIFITGLQGHLEKALDHFALSYITKPIDVIKLKKTIDHYLTLKERLFTLDKLKLTKALINNQSGRLFVHKTNEHLLLEVKDIVKIEADGNYAIFYLQNGSKHLASHSLKYYENLLSKDSFFKAHRSTLVNIRFVKSIYKKETLLLTNGDQVHVSTRNKSNLQELIGLIS
jgi:two-component system LytT family response regulator